MKVDYGVFGDVLAAASIGSWKIEIDDGREPRMYADATMRKLIGIAENAELSPEETYHAWYDRVDSAHYDAVAEGVGHMINGEMAEVQYPWHHPDGRTIVVRCGGVRDRSYTTGSRVAGIHQWVTTMYHVDRVAEEQQRRLMEYKTRADIIKDVIKAGQWYYHLDAENRITIVSHNEDLCRLIDNEYEDCEDAWTKIIHPEDLPAALKAFKAAIADRSGKTPYDVIFRMCNRKGDYKWFRSAGRVVRSEDGGGDFIGTLIDISEIMRQQQERLLGAVPISLDVLSKANIGLWAFELDEGQPPRMYHDKTMLGLVGLDHQLPPEEAYHAWYDHVDKDCYQLVNDAVAKMMAGEHAEVQYPWHHPDGHTMIVRCGGVRNFSYTKGIRVEGTHQDVSAMLRYDDEEEKRRRELAVAKASSEAKTSFLFNMSHDIRTPMNAIMGFSDIALKNLDDASIVKSCIEKSKNAGGLLLSLINSILDMSRIESGKVKVEEMEADVFESFRGVESTMRALAVAKSINLVFEYGEITDRYVYADCDRATRVFVNLISNAIKYTRAGGWVKVRCEEVKWEKGKGKSEREELKRVEVNSSLEIDGDSSLYPSSFLLSPSKKPGTYAFYRYIFEDNGIGMSEEYQKHLYENFSREQNSTTSGIQGTGLGLALCKSLVELMGGTISCRSKQGVGTTFVVELPLRVREQVTGNSEQVDGRARIPAAPGLDGGPGVSALPSFAGKRVLLVEDNELNREVATYVLKESGFEIDTAEDGSIAVRIVKEKGFGYYDYILMDIQMPIMGGYEATKAIRAWEEGKVEEWKSGEVERCGSGTTPPPHHSTTPPHIPIIALSANAFAEDKAASIAAGMDDHVAKPIKVKELMDCLAKFG